MSLKCFILGEPGLTPIAMALTMKPHCLPSDITFQDGRPQTHGSQKVNSKNPQVPSTCPNIYHLTVNCVRFAPTSQAGLSRNKSAVGMNVPVFTVRASAPKEAWLFVAPPLKLPTPGTL